MDPFKRPLSKRPLFSDTGNGHLSPSPVPAAAMITAVTAAAAVVAASSSSSSAAAADMASRHVCPQISTSTTMRKNYPN